MFKQQAKSRVNSATQSMALDTHRSPFQVQFRHLGGRRGGRHGVGAVRAGAGWARRYTLRSVSVPHTCLFRAADFVYCFGRQQYRHRPAPVNQSQSPTINNHRFTRFPARSQSNHSFAAFTGSDNRIGTTLHSIAWLSASLIDQIVCRHNNRSILTHHSIILPPPAGNYHATAGRLFDIDQQPRQFNIIPGIIAAFAAK